MRSETCEACSGRGWIVTTGEGNGRAARCPKCWTLDARLRAAGVGVDLLQASWDTWRGARPDVSPFLRPGERLAGLSAEERLQRVSTLTLLGPTGNGKSHCAVAILREWVQAGYRCRFVEVPEMLEGIKATFGTDENGEEALDGLRRYDLLVLDEAYAQRSTPWADDTVSRLIRGSMRAGQPLIITTNLDEQQLHQTEPRVYSRMAGGLVIPFDDADRRVTPLPQ